MVYPYLHLIENIYIYTHTHTKRHGLHIILLFILTFCKINWEIKMEERWISKFYDTIPEDLLKKHIFEITIFFFIFI
jgi:hypothetical protein